MHHIQRKILIALLYAKTLHYADMRPVGVESNHFAYHLDQLVKAGFVAKKDRSYFLAPSGLALVDRQSQEKMVERLQPHIVTAIHITNDHGQTLLFRRNFQPFIYRIGLILGKTHFEESVNQAALRELQEKSGLNGIALTHRGIAYVESKMGDLTISKVQYHIFQGQVSGTPDVTTNPLRGEIFWGDDSTYTPQEYMPGYTAIKKLLKDNQSFFFAEISEQV